MTQARALEIMKSGANVFLTGEPGSGKTHTLNEYVRYLREHEVEPAITASTGIAATHVGGFTIHSWSGIGIKRSLNNYDLDRIASREYIVKRMRRASVLIIDEVSMLGPETLDMVDAVCREVRGSEAPFGGMQVVLTGDFFQLPPVVRQSEEERANPQTALISAARSRFAYESGAWARARMLSCYLHEQHRQEDATFLALLSAMRGNAVTPEHVAHLHKRKVTQEATKSIKNVPKLFSHNVDVNQENETVLATLPGKSHTFEMTSKGPPALCEALARGCLSPEFLVLKVGASVMCTKNSVKDGYVNGTLATVQGFSKETGYPVIKTRRGRTIEIEPTDWTVEEGGAVKARISQVPLRLAWAITVHKSQGQSLDAAIMDLSEVFEYGQGYVALSRVRTLEGLHLLGWNDHALRVHPKVLVQDKHFRDSSSEADTVFAKMSSIDLRKMHSNFITVANGKKRARI